MVADLLARARSLLAKFQLAAGLRPASDLSATRQRNGIWLLFSIKPITNTLNMSQNSRDK